MSKEQELQAEQVESDALDDSIVYVWVTKGPSGYYFLGSAYPTKQAAEKYLPTRNKGYEYALVRIDLLDINFSSRLS